MGVDRIMSDVRDEAHLNARRATRGKYEWELINYEKESAEQRHHNGERRWDWDGDV